MPVEVLGDETSYSKLMANPNGSFTETLYTTPIQMKVDGSWVPTDTTLTPNAAGGAGSQATMSGLSIGGGGTAPFASILAGGERLKIAWPAKLGAPTLAGDVGTFTNASVGQDLAVRSLAQGFEFSVILKQRPPAGGMTVALPLDAGSLVPSINEGGVLVFTDAAGTVKAFVGRPIVYSAGGPALGESAHRQTTGSLAIGHIGASQVLYMTVPSSFLDDPLVKYPVTIDPAVETPPSDANYDTSYSNIGANAAGTSGGTNYAGSWNMAVGKYQGYLYRTLISFNSTAVNNHWPVSSANLQLWNWASTACNMGFPGNIYEAPGGWSQTTPTWNYGADGTGSGYHPRSTNLGGVMGPSVGSTGCAAAYVSSDVTTALRDWSTGGVAAYGFWIRGNEAASGDSARDYYATENSDATRPRLTVTYSPPAPGAPSSASATPTGGCGQMSVSWPTPANNGSPITGYTITNVNTGATTSASGSPATISGLTNGTSYTFKVYATNAGGNGPNSPNSNSATPYCAPGAPSSASATPTGGCGQMSVSWPTPANNGSPITGYTITNVNTGATTSASGSPATISGLTNGTSYTFKVYATNAGGNGPNSPNSNSATPYCAPSAPSAPTAIATSACGSVSLSWTAPNNNGSPITGYTITNVNTGGTMSASTSPATVTGLTNGTSYTFTVKATNAAGTGPASPASNAATPYCVPAAPPSVTATATGVSGQVSLSWTTPANNGSAITGYTITNVNTGATSPAASSPQTINGLTNGTSYTFRVAATNAAGTGPSTTSNAAVPYTVPGAPTTVVATSNTTTITVTWAAPVQTYGCAVDGYRVALFVDGAVYGGTGSPNWAYSSTVGSGTLTYTFDSAHGNPQVGHAYRVEVWAHNCSADDGGNGVGYSTGTVSNAVALVPAAPATELPLGLESWWSYASMPTGDRAIAKVNVADGNLVLAQNDSTSVSAHGRLAFSLSRDYNSLTTAADSSGSAFAKGWRLNFGQDEDLGGATVGITGLLPPNGSRTLVAPANLTLVDADGTRHDFTPATANPILAVPIASNVLATLGGLGVSAGANVCLDQSYTAPAGVHLSLWRYVQLGAGTACANRDFTTGATVVGYVAERPDRLRYVFASTGELVSVIDPAGNELRYTYDNPPANPVNMVTGLGRLRSVVEQTASCNSASTSSCRAYRLNYSDTDASTCAAPAGGGLAWCVTDPAHETSRYEIATGGHLSRVVDPDGHTTSYAYGSDAACAGTGATSDQICLVTDRRGDQTQFTYADSATAFGTQHAVTSMRNRRLTTTKLTYTVTGGVSTLDADTPTAVGGTCGTNDPSCRRVDYTNIDNLGRVHTMKAGSAASGTGQYPHITDYSWNTTAAGAGCQYPGNATAPNMLCEVVQEARNDTETGQSNGISTNDRDTTYGYTADGAPALVSVKLDTDTSGQTSAAPALVTTYGYTRQSVHADATTDVCTLSVAGAGGFTSSGCGAGSGSPVLYTITDRTQALPPRGNYPDAGKTYTQFLTTYTVDNKISTDPNTYTGTATYCANPLVAAGNTGLVCEIDSPAPTGAASPNTTRCPTATATTGVCTRYVYNGNGQRTASYSPKANTGATPGAGTAYTYYGSSDTDLSGTVNADGWLKAVTDPAGNFVAFGYDAYGELTDTWDRNATAGTTVNGYPNETSYPTYSQTLRGGISCAGGPKACPGRYVTETSTSLRERTVLALDANGNLLTRTPPRGTASSGSSDFDVTATYTADDQLATQTTPTGAWNGTSNTKVTTAFTYDGAGNKTREDDPPLTTGASTNPFHTWTYDTVNRLTGTSWSRGTSASTDGCTLSGTQTVCSTSQSYDGIDNVLTMTDARGTVTTNTYDSASRKLTLRTPRSATRTLTSATGYDRDGDVLLSCSPREYDSSEPGSTSACNPASPGPYSTTTLYDTSDHATQVTRYRRVGSTNTALTTSTTYDADGNPTTVTDPRGNATTTAYDLLDRKTSQTNPRSSSALTRWDYWPSGDRQATEMPDANDIGGGTQHRITAYSYDPDHRLIDTVEGSSNINAALAGGANTSSVGGGGSNTRTRRAYDADGNVTDIYDARAFASSDGSLPATPDGRYHVHTSYDDADRPIAQQVPRYDTSSASGLNTTDAQSAQCPAATGYPSGVGVCTTHLTYDTAGNVTIRTLPSTVSGAGDHTAINRTTTTTWTDDHLRLTVTSPDPRNTDSTGSQLQTTAYAYDGNGQLVSTTNSDETTPHTISRSLDELVTATSFDPTGSPAHDTATTYNANGQVLTETDGNAADPTKSTKTVTTYYSDGLTNSGADGAGDTTSYVYDNDGNPQTTTSPDGNVTSYTYTADNLVSTIATPITSGGSAATSRRVTYGYDDGSRKTSETTDKLNSSGSVTSSDTMTFGYYQNDRPYQTTGRASSGAGSIQQITYDPAGNPINNKDASQGVADISSTYYLDDLLRSTSIAGPDPSNTSTNQASKTSYDYDGNGQIVLRQQRLDTTPNGGSTTTSFHNTAYTYNDAGLPVSATADGNSSWTWTYDTLGQPASGTQPNGTSLSWSYDSDDTLSDQQLSNGATKLAHWTYTYDELSRVIGQTLVAADSTDAGTGTAVNGAYAYLYNNAGRLSTFTDTIPSTGASRTRYSIYDADGNRTGYGDNAGTGGAGGTSCAANANTVCFTYNLDDSIATQSLANPGGSSPATVTRTYAYDGDGRQTSDGCTSYTYDGYDRMTSSLENPATTCGTSVAGAALGPGSQIDTTLSASYTYDALGRQRTHTDTTSVTTSTTLNGIVLPVPAPTTTTTSAISGERYDGTSTTIVAEDNSSSTGQSATTNVDYLLSADGTPLAATDRATGTLSMLNTDGRGTPTTVTNPSGSVICTARFDPYGTPERVNTGTDQDPQHVCNTGSTISDVWYHAGRRDEQTGTYQLGTRTYDPTKAAFTTPDSYTAAQPAADTVLTTDPATANTYTYVNGDPLNNIDPDGHIPVTTIACDSGESAAECAYTNSVAGVYGTAGRRYAKSHPYYGTETQALDIANRLANRRRVQNEIDFPPGVQPAPTPDDIELPIGLSPTDAAILLNILAGSTSDQAVAVRDAVSQAARLLSTSPDPAVRSAAGSLLSKLGARSRIGASDLVRFGGHASLVLGFLGDIAADRYINRDSYAIAATKASVNLTAGLLLSVGLRLAAKAGCEALTAPETEGVTTPACLAVGGTAGLGGAVLGSEVVGPAISSVVIGKFRYTAVSILPPTPAQPEEVPSGS